MKKNKNKNFIKISSIFPVAPELSTATGQARDSVLRSGCPNRKKTETGSNLTGKDRTAKCGCERF
jgi:hypothetical protein